MNKNNQKQTEYAYKTANYIKNNQFSVSISLIFIGTFNALASTLWLHGWKLPQNILWLDWIKEIGTTNSSAFNNLISNQNFLGHTLFTISVFSLLIGFALLLQADN